MLTLEYTKRDSKGKVKNARTGGKLPAVFYGPKEKSQAISISEIAFQKAYNEAGESTVLSLKGDTGEHEALIHDVQFDPVKGHPIHVDFYVIEKGKKVQVDVPINFEGVSPAEKTLGGVLVKVMHEVEIEAMPKDLPHELIANVETLVDFESVMHAKDLQLPEGVSLITSPDETIALVQEPKEEEEVPVEAPDLSSIEVEEKGKKEEGDGGGDSEGGEDSGDNK